MGKEEPLLLLSLLIRCQLCDQTCSLFDSRGGGADGDFGQQKANKQNFIRGSIQNVAQM